MNAQHSNSAEARVTKTEIDQKAAEIHNALDGKTPLILRLDGGLACLRNDHPINIEYEGITYPSVAHAFAASSTDNVAVRKKIAETADIKKAEYMAKSATPNFKVNYDRVDKLAQLLLAKFQEPGLRKTLKLTGVAQLVYVNQSDSVWGVVNGRGFNFLGQTLMAARQYIIEEDKKNV